MELDKENLNKFPQIIRTQFQGLGTEIDVRLVVKDENQKTLAKIDVVEIEKKYEYFTKIFSRFDRKSELSKINGSIGEFVSASDHMVEVVFLSLEYNQKTNGLYDPRILDVLEKVGYADDFKSGNRGIVDGSSKKKDLSEKALGDDLKIKNKLVFFGEKMDFSGIAKGYITDQIAKFLIGKKWKNFLVDSGGDMCMQGHDESGAPWTVGIEGISENKIIFTINKKGVATSGISKRKWEIEGRRIHHIINPKKTDIFSFDLKSVSVIADSTVEADVLAKTIFLMGKIDGMVYAREHNLAVVILDYSGTAWISPEARAFIV